MNVDVHQLLPIVIGFQGLRSGIEGPGSRVKVVYWEHDSICGVAES